MAHLSDIEIAQAATLKPVLEIGKERLGLPEDAIENYGKSKAKLDLEHLASLPENPDAKLILVTAISPTKAGEGKTTTSVGLSDGLNRIGKNTLLCLREPSLGPSFGMKGGAAGGGYAQVIPMEEINLHFTGDFHAMTSANNLLAAMVDNHLYWGNSLNIDPRRISWKRALDMNDRALRQVTNGLGGPTNGDPRTDGFDITVASEIMAIFCLAKDHADLRERLARIQVGPRKGKDKSPVTAADLKASGAMAVLLKDALRPNLVQTLENNPALVHGGPFANIAHGCNSVVATKSALKLADYVVTEAGFGADLGCEKFFDIKCRKAGLRPSAVVIVATIRALKMHGGVAETDTSQENVAALEQGFANLERHVQNVGKFGVPAVVAINSFTADTDAERAKPHRTLRRHRRPLHRIRATGHAAAKEPKRSPRQSPKPPIPAKPISNRSTQTRCRSSKRCAPSPKKSTAPTTSTSPPTPPKSSTPGKRPKPPASPSAWQKRNQASPPTPPNTEPPPASRSRSETSASPQEPAS